MSQVLHSTELWFEDGSVVLAAGNIYFKVYHGILAAHSIVFKDMLALPRSIESRASQAFGCPLVRVTDSPEDLTHLLKVLFLEPNIQGVRKANFPFISAIVRLSHKYQIDSLLEQGLNILKDYYTASYNSWIRRDQNVLLAEPVHAIDAIHIAHLTETPSILPAAFLQCAFLGGQLVQGCRREDGSIVRLSDEDLERCLTGRDLLNRRIDENLRFMAGVVGNAEGYHGCPSTAYCSRFIHQFWMAANAGDVGPRDALRPWLDLLAEFTSEKLCKSCLAFLKSDPGIAGGRTVTWALLPQFFDIDVPDWS